MQLGLQNRRNIQVVALRLLSVGLEFFSVVHCLAALESALEISSCSSGRLAYRTIKTRSSGGCCFIIAYNSIRGKSRIICKWPDEL